MTARVRAATQRFRRSITGLSPETVALIFVLGLVLGVFPVYGAPTVLCAVVAVALRLNVAAVQIINQLCSPLQIALLVPLGRAGERIPGLGQHPAVWNLADAARNAVVGWCCFCVPAGIVAYVILAAVLHCRRRNALPVTGKPA